MVTGTATLFVMESPSKNGARLRAARKKAKLTQEALGDLLDPKVTKQAIYKMETGRLRIMPKTAAQLSAALGNCKTNELVDEDFLVFDGSRTDARQAELQEGPAHSGLSTIISATRYEAFVRPFFIDHAGAQKIENLDDNFFIDDARDCQNFIEQEQKFEPEVSVTSHLTQWILLSLGAVLGANPAGQNPSYPQLRKSAEGVAVLLTNAPQSSPAANGRRKSG